MKDGFIVLIDNDSWQGPSASASSMAKEGLIIPPLPRDISESNEFW